MLYIKNYHVITIYNSKKINPEFRKLHLRELHHFKLLVEELYEKAYRNLVTGTAK
jgi:hypothetical protein